MGDNIFREKENTGKQMMKSVTVNGVDSASGSLKDTLR